MDVYTNVSTYRHICTAPVVSPQMKKFLPGKSSRRIEIFIISFLSQLTETVVKSTNLVKEETMCTPSNLTICLPLMCFVTKQ